MADRVYEVFLCLKEGGEFVHVGELEAPEPKAALLFAKEHWLRRDPAVGIWVVDRADVHASEWPFEVMASGAEKRYRKTPGRSAREK
ncbi:1,2-phenylacetyl-CoA epoxidase subunit B [Nocardioides marmoriginsengisoli]|nr:1,2-phenylacetyl-CoA epoxidase subunit B [Nocardioides marmoriginsengisoli]